MKKTATKTKTETAAVTDAPLQSTPMGEFKILPLNQVRPDPNQPRKVFNAITLSGLAESIKAQGILQPILVRWVEAELQLREPDMLHALWQAVDRAGAVVFEGHEDQVKAAAAGKTEGYHQIVDGERRWRAAELAELAEVPVIVRPFDAQKVFNAQWTANQARENLNALEEAASFEKQIADRKAIDALFNADKLALELGIARSTVYNRLKLTRLHGPVRIALEDGSIDPTVAGEICAIPSREDQEEMLDIIRQNQKAGQEFSFREVRAYIDANFVKQLADAPFDTKDEDILAGVDTAEGLCYTSCTKCPMRSGNMKEMFPEIKNVNVCTSPKCFAEKCKAHQAKAVDELKENGHLVISWEEFCADRQEIYVRENDALQVGARYMSVLQIIGKKKVKAVKIQRGSAFDECYRREDVIEAGKANGLDFTPPPKPKAEPKPKPVEKPKVKPSPEMSEAEKEKLLEQQRKAEEKARKEREREEAQRKLAEDTAKAALERLQMNVEKLPVNAKSETEFWQFMCSRPGFLAEMIFYSGHQNLFQRRGLKGELEKVISKMSYQEFRGAVLEQMLTHDSELVMHNGQIDTGLVAACKEFGVDLKKLERELADKNGELAGMPEPVKKAKKKGKK